MPVYQEKISGCERTRGHYCGLYHCFWLLYSRFVLPEIIPGYAESPVGLPEKSLLGLLL